MALKAKKKGLSRRTRDTLEAYLLIAGNYLVYAVFVLLPLIFTLYYSFTNYDLYQQCDFVGLENYINLLTDKVFQIALLNTCLYSGQRNFVKLFKSALANEIELIKIRKGESENE